MYLKKLMEDGVTYWPIQVDETDFDGIQALRDSGYIDATQEEFENRHNLGEALDNPINAAGATGTSEEEGQGNDPESIQPIA